MIMATLYFIWLLEGAIWLFAFFFVENLQDKNPVNYAGYTPLHRAARKGHLNICKLIIQNVQNKNPENNDRNTPLHSAAERGQIDVCKLIIESLQKETLGRNQVQTLIIVNPMNRFGYTPVDMAERFGHRKICYYINSVAKKENPAANRSNPIC